MSKRNSFLFLILLLSKSSIQIFASEIYKLPSEINSDTAIIKVIKEINPDSIKANIQKLQDFGSRYSIKENRHTIAEWLKQKFLSFGNVEVEIDSFLCKIKNNNTLFEAWKDTVLIQKNVIATIKGDTYPDNVIIIGGHYDSYNQTDSYLYNNSPGADDNGSGTAGVLEIARAISKSGYKPQSTIKFVLFGAEELMNSSYSGGKHFAESAKEKGTQISLMINLDMIANSKYPASDSTVKINYYSTCKYLLEYAKENTKKHSSLTGLTGAENQSSDSHPFWMNGFPAIYFEETVRSPYYHHFNDKVENLNTVYCAEVAKAACGMLLNNLNIKLPKIPDISTFEGGDGKTIHLQWDKLNAPYIKNYKIYWGTDVNSMTNSRTVTENKCIVDGLTAGTKYYINVCGVASDYTEGFSNIITVTPHIIPEPPCNVSDLPLNKKIQINWIPNTEKDIDGYNVYRAEKNDGTFTKINSALIKDSFFTDDNVLPAKYYFYYCTAIDSAGNESSRDTVIRSKCISLDQGLLIVDNTFDDNGTLFRPSDKDVDDYYEDLTKNVKHQNYDIIQEGGIKLADLGAYEIIIWNNDYYKNNNITPAKYNEEIKKYLLNGGKLIYSGYRPSNNLLIDSSGNRNKTDFLYRQLKIKSSAELASARYSGAIPAGFGYQILNVDSAKIPSGSLYNSHLLNIESIYPDSEATSIFNYNSKYDTIKTEGKMKGMPVGVEYLGKDYKTIVLSFPLYFMKKEEAKQFIINAFARFGMPLDVLTNKEEQVPNEYSLNQNYPNPFNPSTTIEYSVPNNSKVVLEVFDILGQKVTTLVNSYKPAGFYKVEFNSSHLASGIYLYNFRAGNILISKKMLLIK